MRSVMTKKKQHQEGYLGDTEPSDTIEILPVLMQGLSCSDEA